MGKRKWRRVNLADLGGAELQERVLKVLDQAKGQSEPKTCIDRSKCTCGKRASESPQVER